LVRDDPVVHESTDDSQDNRVEEQFGGETRPLERHRQKMAMRPTVRRVTALKIRQKTRPECVSARVNDTTRQMAPQDTEAFVSKFADRPLNSLVRHDIGDLHSVGVHFYKAHGIAFGVFEKSRTTTPGTSKRGASTVSPIALTAFRLAVTSATPR
jgi:hypothetical protein